MIAEYVPTGIFFVLFVVFMITLSQAGRVVFTRWYKSRNLPHDNEVMGIIFGSLSLIYSLLIAFAIIAVWGDYEELNNTIEKETDKLNSILAHSTVLPDSINSIIRHTVTLYCKRVVNDEWTMQDAHIPHQPSAIPQLRLLLLNYVPQTKTQESIFFVLDENLSDISDLRRERLSHTRSHVPALVWIILQAGSLVVIAFPYLFHTNDVKLERIYVSFLSGMIAMCLFLVYMLDHPYTGSTQVSNVAYRRIIQAAQTVQGNQVNH